MLSGSPLSFTKSRGEWLWKRWPATWFSLASKASPLNLLLDRAYALNTLTLVGASTQSNRRRTVIGSITRSYCGGRYGPRKKIGDLPDQVCEIGVVRH